MYQAGSPTARKTMAENTLDMLKKGRNQHKLSIEQVREIRELRKSGKLLRELAEQYGVSVGHIGNLTTKSRFWSWA